ncbi:MAG: hypothetical protein GY927_00175 [bacterium]|nr:hypothetical protein [bacterium]
MHRNKNAASGLHTRSVWHSAGAAIAVFAMLLVVSATLPQEAVGAEPKKQLSGKAVKYLMSLTWAIMPDKIKGPGGKEIPIDKTKRDEAQVPLDDARRVIMVARRSAHAQICKMPKLQKANYRTMMKLELKSKKWSRKQIVYLNQLHLFTVMWLTGNVTISEDETKKDEKKKKIQTCTSEQQVKVKAQIEKYLKANPLPEETAKKDKAVKQEKTAKKDK